MNSAENIINSEEKPTVFLRKRDFVGKNKALPVSDATFFRLVRTGKFPKAIKISERVSVWRSNDVQAALERLGSQPINRGGQS